MVIDGHVVKVEPVTLGHAIQTAAIDPEDLGGALLIALGGTQDRLDMVLLELFQGE
jgi:hypothetical protein